MTRLGHVFGQPVVTFGKGDCGSCPYEGNNPLCHHGAVEHRACQPFVFHATCHHGRLRGVEAGNRTAGYRDEQHRENGVGGASCLRIMVAKAGSKCIRHRYVAEKHHPHKTYGHEQQYDCKQGVDVAYQLVDREHRCHKVVDEYHHCPECGIEAVGSKRGHKAGCCHHEYPADQYQQHNREGTHHLPDAGTEFPAYDFGERGAVGPERNHAGDIVMYRPRKNSA